MDFMHTRPVCFHVLIQAIKQENGDFYMYKIV